jgi:hypothetical protein
VTIAKVTGWVLIGLVGIAAIGFGLGFVVMLLWNWLMPAIFDLPELGYWQAVGLTILCHLLFKSHMHHRHRDEKHPKHIHDFRSRVRSMIHPERDETPAGDAPAS